MTGDVAHSADLLRRAVALVFVEDLDTPSLAPDDVHHLGSVRRIRPGEVVAAGDGAGRYRPCSLVGERRDLRLEPTGNIRSEPAPTPTLTVAMSLAKADRTEWAAAKLTELGVDRIVPLVCERSVVPAGSFRRERLWRIVRESAMQARRAYLPRLDDPIRLADLVGGLAAADRDEPGAGGAGGVGGVGGVGGAGVPGVPDAPSGSTGNAGSATIALAEPGGGRLSLATPTVLIGPEGGWTPAELDIAAESGVSIVGLGPTILRIETAAVAAGALLTALRSGHV